MTSFKNLDSRLREIRRVAADEIERVSGINHWHPLYKKLVKRNNYAIIDGDTQKVITLSDLRRLSWFNSYGYISAVLGSPESEDLLAKGRYLVELRQRLGTLRLPCPPQEAEHFSAID